MKPWAFWLFMIGAGILLAVTSVLYVQSVHRYTLARQRLISQSEIIANIQRLELAYPSIAVPVNVDGDLLPRIQRALSRIGLPPAACAGVMPQGDQVQPNGLIRRTIAVTLAGLSIPDFGQWLEVFRGEANPWRVIEVQCGSGGGGLDTGRYSISLRLELDIPQDQAP